MASIIIIGDGPGGLSAALFLSKNDQIVTVYGTDDTAMHYALLRNYLGIPETPGTEFQEFARMQVAGFGAAQVDGRVIEVAAAADGFTITLEDGSKASADYLILSEGLNPELARSLGVAEEDDGVVVDRNGRSSVDRVYVIGRSARRKRSQAIISAGDGAAAAIDIMARETGADFTDWDSPPDEGA